MRKRKDFSIHFVAQMQRPWIVHAAANAKTTTEATREYSRSATRVAKYAMDAYAIGFAQARGLSKKKKRRETYNVLKRGLHYL